MRILRLNDWTGPPGGAESYVTAVARSLEEAGHPQRTISLTDAPSVSEYRAERWERIVPLRPMGPRRLAEDLGAEPREFGRVVEAIDEFRPEIVHLHHYDSWFVPFARLLRASKVPLVMTAHDAKLVCPIGTLVLPDGSLCTGRILPRCQFTGCAVGLGLGYKLTQDRFFRTYVAPRVRLYLAPSRAAGEFLERHRLSPVQVLPPFIEVPPAVESSPPPLPEGPPTLGFLGRLETYKGPFTLLEAFLRARERVPGLRLILAGRGPAEARLREEVRRHGREVEAAVELPGWVSGAAKETFFSRIHVLAVPSEGYENFGLIGLEAFVRGRPALGSRLGGIPDWLEHEGQGLLLPPGDVRAWTEGLVAAFSDRARLARWGEAARRRYHERFRPEVHLRELLAAYERVLSGQGPTQGPAPVGPA